MDLYFEGRLGVEKARLVVENWWLLDNRLCLCCDVRFVGLTVAVD